MPRSALKLLTNSSKNNIIDIPNWKTSTVRAPYRERSLWLQVPQADRVAGNHFAYVRRQLISGHYDN